MITTPMGHPAIIRVHFIEWLATEHIQFMFAFIRWCFFLYCRFSSKNFISGNIVWVKYERVRYKFRVRERIFSSFSVCVRQNVILFRQTANMRTFNAIIRSSQLCALSLDFSLSLLFFLSLSLSFC